MKIDAALSLSCLDSVIDTYPLKVNAQTPIRQVIQLMNQTQKGCALIMSSQTDTSSLVGIFTEQDVIEFVANHSLEQNYQDPIAQVMSWPVFVISQLEATNLLKITETINQYQVPYLPVVNLQGKVIGLISYKRLLYQLNQFNIIHSQALNNKNHPQTLHFENIESPLFQLWIKNTLFNLTQEERDSPSRIFKTFTTSSEQPYSPPIKSDNLVTEPQDQNTDLILKKTLVDTNLFIQEKIEALKPILETTKNPVIITDPLGNIIYFNQYAQQIYHWEISNILNRPWNQVLFSPDQQKLAINIFQKLLQTGSWQGNLTLQPQPNIQVSAQLSVLKDSQQKIIGTLCFFSNFEPELENESIFLMLDSGGIIISVSEEISTILSLDISQVIGKSFLDLVTKESQLLIHDLLVNFRVYSKVKNKTLLIKSENQLIECMINIEPLFNENHQIQNILITLTQSGLMTKKDNSNIYLNLLSNFNSIQQNENFHESIPQLSTPEILVEIILNQQLLSPQNFQQPLEKDSLPSTHPLTQNQQLDENQLNIHEIKFYLKLLKKFSDTTPQIIYVYHLQEQRNIYVNHQFTALLGHPTDIVKSANNTFFIDHVHPDDLPKLALQLQRFATAQDHEVMQLEYRIKNAKGEWRWLQGWEMIFVRNESGDPQQIIGVATDITLKKETEITLKKNEELYRLLAENSTDLITRYTLKGRCLYVSPACRVLLGYEPKELLGYSAYSKFHPQDLPFLQQVQKAILGGEGMQTLCYRIRHKQGHYVWMETNIHAINDPQTGTSVALIGTSRDISERKQAEDALKLSQQRLQSILNSLQDIVWSAEFETSQLLYLNPIATHIYERPLEDFFKNQNLWLEVIHPEDRVRVEDNFKKALNLQLTELEYRIIRPSGEIRWIRDRCWIVYNQAGEPIRKNGLATDITEHKQVEEKLQLTQDKLEYLLNSNPAVIYSADAFSPYAVKFISQNVTRILGYSSQLFIENSDFWCNHLHPEDVDHVFAQFPKLFEVSGHLQIDYRFLVKETSYRWIRNEMRLIRDQNNHPVEIVGYMADITPQKIAETETYKALAKYQELSQLRSRFITLTSHEFRTPLCTILSSADLLEFYTEQRAIEKQKEHIERIQNSALHLTNLLSDILTFSQTNVDQLSCYPEPFDLASFCRQIIKEISMNEHYQHPIHFVSDECLSTPCLDQKLLRYILINLLSNAVKYSPPGHPVFIEVSSQKFPNSKDSQFIQVSPTQPMIIFKVQDQGIGILCEDKSRIFDSFYRGNNLENQPGVGLGLAIVKKAVEAHGGYITFETQVGVGTTFIVALPWMEEEEFFA